MSQLVTGEAVVLDLRTAGVPSRVLAALLDMLVQSIGGFALFFLVAVAASSLSEAAASGLFIALLVLVTLGYPVLMETLASGRTLGKMVLGLRVVRDDGGPIGFRHAITRGLLGVFVEKPGFTFGSAGIITALLNERGKRLGDLLAGTVVVQERVASSRLEVVSMPPPLAAWASTLDLSALPDDLAESARSYLGRWGSLTPTAQADLGSRLATAVAAVVTPAPPAQVPPWAYLSAVLAERRRRAGYGVSVAPVAPASLAGYSSPGYAQPPVGYGPPLPPPTASPVEESPAPAATDSPFAPPV
jgi:uncharacterized RDD family membrane protein YckC